MTIGGNGVSSATLWRVEARLQCPDTTLSGSRCLLLLLTARSCPNTFHDSNGALQHHQRTQPLEARCLRADPHSHCVANHTHRCGVLLCGIFGRPSRVWSSDLRHWLPAHCRSGHGAVSTPSRLAQQQAATHTTDQSPRATPNIGSTTRQDRGGGSIPVLHPRGCRRRSCRASRGTGCDA